MTDIHHHLKGIRKHIRRYLTQEQEIYSYTIYYEVVRAILRDYLPASYGVKSGCLVNQHGNKSDYMPIIVYDQNLAESPSKLYTVRIDDALLICDFAFQYTRDELNNAYSRIQSVKRLAPRKNRQGIAGNHIHQAQRRANVPAHRLPYALVMCNQIVFGRDEDVFTTLRDDITHIPPPERPDEVVALEQNLLYLNPLLEDDTARPEYIGWGHMQDRSQTRSCYVCNDKFIRKHFFYDRLCVRCGDINYAKRQQTANLDGYIALVTGGRIKIGYATVLKLLRAGARVIVTTRFPQDAARKYTEAPDFDAWKDRLHIYGIDFRKVDRLEAFIAHLYDTYPHLDILVNNAAQTIWRPVAYYRHLLAYESNPPAQLPAALELLGPPSHNAQSDFVMVPVVSSKSPLNITEEDTHFFPPDDFDEYGEQSDYRPFNSWVTPLEDVSVMEMVEVHLINAVAPAALTGQLRRLMEKSPHERRFVVNVSAAEGRFNQYKAIYHPHTNMAKAAMNMLTRSIADDYAGSQIYVNSVDPGWVSDQFPQASAESRREAYEALPIDMVDAAARICDPIFQGMTGRKMGAGKLLKDYRIVEW